jgi:hypothetical protein
VIWRVRGQATGISLVITLNRGADPAVKGLECGLVRLPVLIGDQIVRPLASALQATLHVAPMGAALAAMEEVITLQHSEQTSKPPPDSCGTRAQG